MSHPYHETIEKIITAIMGQLEERDVEVNRDFITFVVHLLIRDMRLGLKEAELKKLSQCTLKTFIDRIVDGYRNPADTTMANMWMSWIMKMGHGIKLSYVQEQYELKFQHQLKLMTHDILQYPETCNKVQLDQLFSKMQVFIATSYHLGCPKNHVLLKLTAQALHSVIGRSDLQNYVLKKKYHRQEYLQRLASTVAGIVIYTSDGPDGDRENVRSVINDLEMAQNNTNTAFEKALNRLRDLAAKCQAAISEQLQFNNKETLLFYRVPLEHLQRINQYTVTFIMLRRSLDALQRSYKETEYLISIEKGRYDCVVSKINDTLCMRTAIKSELVFPHFVYLAKVWNNLNHYFNHIVEINKIREQLELHVPFKMELNAMDTISNVQQMARRRKEPDRRTFDEQMDALNKFPTDGNFTGLAQADIKEFCGLSLAVTNGLLLPANIVRNLCMNLDINFGFKDQTYARIGEVWFERFITALRQAIFNSANLCLLFKLEDILIEREMKVIPVEPPKNQDSETQTEMVVTNDLSVSNWINVTWNAWDYHRETIHLAEIRKRQTRDAQTKVTYGERNAQNQSYNTRQHM